MATDPIADRLKGVLGGALHSLSEKQKELNAHETPPRHKDQTKDAPPTHDPDDPTDWLLPDPDYDPPGSLPTPIPKARRVIRIGSKTKATPRLSDSSTDLVDLPDPGLPEHPAPESPAPEPEPITSTRDWTIPPAHDPTNPAPYWAQKSITSENFDLKTYLSTIPNLPTLLKHQKGRLALTRLDPFLFALTYLPQHLKQEGESLPTFADCHFEWCRYALGWAKSPTPMMPSEKYKRQALMDPDHHAFIAPRNTGKTTWWFLILPMWAAAHGHKKFLAAFSDTATQAQTHLATFKAELDNNELLRKDFPLLCFPLRRANQRAAVADRADQYTATNGFTFAARGIDSSSLGLKVERTRPDVILLDDVEPDERKYSADLANKRLATIEDAVLPLNIFASVIMVGTVTMPNSIMHQLVKSTKNKNDSAEWIIKNKIKAHHYDAIQQREDGSQRSLWPNKWPLEYLLSIKGTRTYYKNYANDPRGRDGDFWNDEDFTRITLPYTTRRSLHIDPPVTATKTSDPAGLAVVSWMPPNREEDPNKEMLKALAAMSAQGSDPQKNAKLSRIGMGVQKLSAPQPKQSKKEAREQRDLERLISRNPGTVMVEHASEVYATGNALFKRALELIAEFGVQRVVIETTQGGDLWLEIFAGCPVPVYTIAPREGKEVRAARALRYYQASPPLVVHDAAAPLAALEEQQLGFPKGARDDMVDATIAGVLYHLEPRREKVKAGAKNFSYRR